MPTEDELISTADAAEILGVTRQAVEKMAALPPVVVGGRRFFVKSEVDRLAGERAARKIR